jgi:hypothetical protein
MAQIPMELVLELPTPDGLTASSITQWISSLQHEALDDAVEYNTVIIPVLGVG